MTLNIWLFERIFVLIVWQFIGIFGMILTLLIPLPLPKAQLRAKQLMRFLNVFSVSQFVFYFLEQQPLCGVRAERGGDLQFDDRTLLLD